MSESESRPPAPSGAMEASNAETVPPSRTGEGAAGTGGGRGEPDRGAVEDAARQADVIEEHSEPAGDDAGMRPQDAPKADPDTSEGP